MSQVIKGLATVAVALAFVGCTAMTGKTAGRNVDDAAITTAVKAKLAKAELSSITRIGVDTDNGIVYLNGVVPDQHTKRRAQEIADSVDGVRRVVNNLQAQTAADQPHSTYSY